MKLLDLVKLGAVATLLTSEAAMAAPADQHPGKVGTVDEFLPVSDFCGTKPLKVAYSSGYSGDPWRKISKAEFELEAAKCPNITEARYTDAQGSVEQQISDIQGLAAQGFDVIIVYPDGGEALLRAMNQAMKRGAKVVPFYGGADFPGTPGRDYVVNVSADQKVEGKMAAEWIAKQLDGKGNVVMLGGAPGAISTQNTYDGAMEVFSKYPDIHMLEDGPVATNWDRAQYQKVMTSLIAKHPKIDAVMSDYGVGAMGGLRAFEATNTPIPLWTTRDANELACFYYDNKDKNPNFQIFTTSAGTWLTRLALRKGLAAANNIEDAEPSIIIDPVIDNTTSDDPKFKPICDKDLPMGAHVSSFTMTKEEMQAVFK
ncbi:substrate-binding domain-containing protein [Pseudooceanicola sp. GBMRC 2024]|uniref:Substrate-binding domain-containing protein n=1 Tax=Pseudooceanicola albus TaxID=2692189 RepID=A0A6L7G380_9RHOB|nr:substrate-binding domain-containing protein [Pseudooceanicola albus]MXN17850.1 substrate-binding domain-containing protein [Pseudooceanicola albus]